MNAILPLLTWLVVLVEFYLHLGGAHPSDERRDLYLIVGAVVLLALQVPLVVHWAKLVRAYGKASLPRRDLVMAAVRVGVAAYIFWFLHGISHQIPT